MQKQAAQKQTEPTKDKNAVTVYQSPDESPDSATARVLSQPETQAAITIQQWQGGIVDVDEIAKELRRQTDALKTGDMRRAEAMLLSQAQTLDELFNKLAQKAQRCEYLADIETYLKLGLKAQNQCRMTLETLSNIKNPPVVYTKQANIAHGPQQVNNGVSTAHAAKKQNQQNELLEVKDGERLDTGTAGKTIGGDKSMATVD